MAFGSKTDDGYELMDLETGEITVMGFSQYVGLLKTAAVNVESSSPLAVGVVERRLGDLKTAEQLPMFQQEHGHFRRAICVAAETLETKLRFELCKPSLRLTGPLLNKAENRKFICKIATDILGKKVRSSSSRGGRNSEWVLYAGRTILKYLALYDDLGPDEDPIAALATRDHLKGNRLQRLANRLLELMTKAWEEIGLDLKATSPANVYKHLQMLVHEENQVRKRNGLKPLIAPSQKTLTAHRNYLLSPTELLVATKGVRHARNKRGRGSSDIRALCPGELVEVDECKLSLISCAKAQGYWEHLSCDDKKTLEEMDEEVRKRLTLLVMIDVATRMPLAWILCNDPTTEATLALYRMATRDKTKEKKKYDCKGDPAPAMGLGMVKTDNGVALRNSVAVSCLLGLSANYTAVRTSASADKPYIERLFGTNESTLLKLIHGYTGRKAGEIPGYDAKANGVLDIDELYGILTRFFIDEYPSMRHMGVGMGGRRPAEVLNELNENRGLFKPLNEDQRRIHLGWKSEVTPNDEGVRVFSGIWYNSEAFQIAIDREPGVKVTVFVDPDNVTEATAIIPGVAGEFRLQLQVTAFADLTVSEVIEVTQAYRKENPGVTEIYEDRIASEQRRRFDQLRKIGVERNLPRSYSTIDEIRNRAASVFSGARVIQSSGNTQTVRPGDINSGVSGPGVLSIGNGEAVTGDLDGNPATVSIKGTSEAAAGATSVDGAEDPKAAPPLEAKTLDPKHQPIGRPKTKGTFK
ncbi:hypothetical protein C1J03_18720 [Sulfitobacter sp. SK012]|nr:hypothetical protein C1J03_18720 [Sulfitobacter sp. SK012]